MSTITTHVLDTARGRPAAGIAVLLERRSREGWEELGRGVTDSDGRCGSLLDPGRLPLEGIHRLCFAAGDYFAANGVASFYDRIIIEFVVSAEGGHYHVPLLLSPFGYSTYRGS